ncbi:hypothetical protein Syun_028807 [Stephania yunnanensis]|uniref:Uncharacterized protein n=1 Tax=Stephania yunnanensis TaxID=152371 RepID=A0AAP0HFH9_9MAGN
MCPVSFVRFRLDPILNGTDRIFVKNIRDWTILSSTHLPQESRLNPISFSRPASLLSTPPPASAKTSPTSAPTTSSYSPRFSPSPLLSHPLSLLLLLLSLLAASALPLPLRPPPPRHPRPRFLRPRNPSPPRPPHRLPRLLDRVGSLLISAVLVGMGIVSLHCAFRVPRICFGRSGWGIEAGVWVLVVFKRRRHFRCCCCGCDRPARGV